MNGKYPLFPLLVLILATIVAGCNFPGTGIASPTSGMNPTQAHQTVIARVTEMASQTVVAGTAATADPTATGGATTTAPSNTLTPSATRPSPTVTPKPCDRAAAGTPIDVTIPDDTEMHPGETFTKIWRLQNVGTCTWTTGYSAVWFSGEGLEAPEQVALAGSVAPGETVDISVEMIAPEQAGTYQGNWKLRNASGVLFGIGPNGDSPFWVRIVVNAPTNTPIAVDTPTPTPSLTPTPTPTPPVHLSGSNTLMPGDQLDLDSNQTNPGQGSDLSYETASDENHPIVPQAGARLGVFGSQQPGLADCRSASMSAAPLPVESLSTGAYLCAQTDQGRYGWVRIDQFDSESFSLSISLLVWAEQ